MRLKLEKDNLDIALARSLAGAAVSAAAGAGTGEVGRLAGLRNAGVFKVYISVV